MRSMSLAMDSTMVLSEEVRKLTILLVSSRRPTEFMRGPIWKPMSTSLINDLWMLARS